MGKPMFGGYKGATDQTSFMSGGRSLGGGLANRMYCALSRVNFAGGHENRTDTFEFDEDEVQEILGMIEELNLNADLVIKLDQHKKIIYLLSSNNDGNETSQSVNKQIISLLKPCLKQLEDLKRERDDAMEDYFEEMAEQKMEQTLDIKKKYKTIFTMLDKSKGKFVNVQLRPKKKRSRSRRPRWTWRSRRSSTMWRPRRR